MKGSLVICVWYVLISHQGKISWIHFPYQWVSRSNFKFSKQIVVTQNAKWDKNVMLKKCISFHHSMIQLIEVKPFFFVVGNVSDAMRSAFSIFGIVNFIFPFFSPINLYFVEKFFFCYCCCCCCLDLPSFGW